MAAQIQMIGKSCLQVLREIFLLFFSVSTTNNILVMIEGTCVAFCFLVVKYFQSIYYKFLPEVQKKI